MKENSTTDEELVLRSQNGDNQAMDELVLRYGGFVRSRARGYFLVGGETEDLIQEGLLGLFSAIRSYKREENGKSFKNFAYLCVSNKIIDAVKRSTSKKNKPLNDSVPTVLVESCVSTAFDPDEAMIALDESKEVRRKMSAVLSDFEFKIFTRYMDGDSCAEICESTGKSQKSVDNAVQRSKRKLLAAFDK